MLLINDVPEVSTCSATVLFAGGVHV